MQKKKPVYDARKAIEEAKLKEAKEGKKEKPSAFREFLREMKKISAEEKAQHNETNNNIDKEKDNNPKVNKKNKNKNKDIKEKKENIKDNREKDKEINLEPDIKSKLDYPKNNIDNNKNKLPAEKIEDNPQNLNNNILPEPESKEVKENSNIQKKNKQNETKEISHRRKLHELEKAPAPILNIKGIKSRIECWSGNNDNKKPKNNLAQREMPKSKDEKKSKNKLNKKMNDLNLPPETNHNNINSSNNSSNNIPKINNKNLEEKIEKYVDKKLMQLSLQIEEIDDLFNLDKYYEEKQNKMKKYLNVPYIKKDYEFIIKFTDENYNAQIEKIQVQYKELK